MTHTDYVFSWNEETTEGVRVRAGTPTDTQMYKFGYMLEPRFPVPYPRADPTKSYVYSKWDFDSQTQGGLTLPHTFTFVMVNGIEFYFALGQSTNTAPSYEQHVITGINKGNLPTRTYHYEAKGGTTDLLVDYVGRKSISTEFRCERGRFLTCTLSTLGGRGTTSKQAIFDNSLGTGPAVEYTNAPIFPPTAVEKGYMFNTDYSCTWDAVAENTLHRWSLGILTSTLKAEQNDMTVDDFGVARKRWPISNWETGIRTVLCTLIMEQNNRNIWDDFLDAVTNKSLDTKFVRGTNDEIFIELDNCQVEVQEIEMPYVAETGLFKILISPETTTVTVKDAVDSDGSPNFYGG